MSNEPIERWYSMNEISEYLGITRDTDAWMKSADTRVIEAKK